MPINFPSSPVANATYSFGGKTWTYTGSAWKSSTANILYISSDSVTEGVTNLYYTDTRVRGALRGSLTSDFLFSNTNISSNVSVTANTSALRISPTNVNSGVFLTIGLGGFLKLI